VRRGSFVAPLLLIGIGALFLARNVYPDLPLLDYLARYWPFLLILWGGLRLIEIVIWSATGRPLPTRGLSGGEWTLAIFLCFLGGSVHAARGFADWLPNSGIRMGGLDVFGESFEYPLSGEQGVGKTPRIVIENFRGNARIVGVDVASDMGRVKVTGHKTVRSLNQGAADQADKSTPFEIVRDTNVVVIRTNQDRATGNQRLSEDMEIEVPRGAAIEAHGRFGDFDINGVNGRVDINSDNAGVRLENLGGEVRMELRRSDVVRAVNVKGALELKGRGADVDFQNIEGQVTIDGSFSGVTELHNLSKPVRFVSPYTEFTAEKVPGELRITIGEINGSNLTGPVRVTSMRNKDVRLGEVSNSLEITLERGDIQVTESAQLPAKIDARTRIGDIDLALAPGAKFDLTASSNRGDVENEYGPPVTFESNKRGGTLHGSNGGPSVSAHTDRGKVTVRRAVAGVAPTTGKQLKPIDQ
jgi:hypothetical protein